MLISVFGNWINPQAILAVVPAGEGSRVVFSNSSEAGFGMEFKDKSAAEVATEINTAILAGRKAAAGDREKRHGGDRDRGGFRGGRDGGFKGKRDGSREGGRDGDRDRSRDGGFEKKYDRDRGDRHSGGEDREKRVRDGFDKRKSGGKFESRPPRGDFKPKKRKDWN